MKRAKGEPGDYIPYDEVTKKLTQPAYGAVDLVEMGLFHTVHFVRDAIACGKLKCQHVNRRAVVLCREDILRYWHKYRSEPYEAANNTLMIKVTLSELEYLAELVKGVRNNGDKEFEFNDLFRNLIQYLMNSSISLEKFPGLLSRAC